MDKAVERVSWWYWAISELDEAGIMHWPMPFMSPYIMSIPTNPSTKPVPRTLAEKRNAPPTTTHLRRSMSAAMPASGTARPYANRKAVLVKPHCASLVPGRDALMSGNDALKICRVACMRK